MRRLLVPLAAAALLALVVLAPAGALPRPEARPAPPLPSPDFRDGNNTTQNQTDTTAPFLTVTSHRDRQTVREVSITLRGTATDDSGTVDLVAVSLNGKDWVPASGGESWSLPLVLEEGANSIAVRASDSMGNVARLDLTIVLSTQTRENTGVILAAAVIVPIVALLLLLAFRRRPLARDASEKEHEAIERRLAREGRKRDGSDAALEDSEEVTRLDGEPSGKRPPGKRS